MRRGREEKGRKERRRGEKRRAEKRREKQKAMRMTLSREARGPQEATEGQQQKKQNQHFGKEL